MKPVLCLVREVETINSRRCRRRREDKMSDSNKFHSAWIGLDAKLTAPQAAADQIVVDDPARLTVPNRSQLISSSWKHPTLV